MPIKTVAVAHIACVIDTGENFMVVISIGSKENVSLAPEEIVCNPDLLSPARRKMIADAAVVASDSARSAFLKTLEEIEQHRELYEGPDGELLTGTAVAN